jgi:membrane protein DedA with SNARE-associated domain
MENPSGILELLIHYRYYLLFPLACIEGPFISLAVGFLIYLGYFSFFPAYGLLILGDIVPDTFYYYLGRFGSRKRFVERYSERFGFVANNFTYIEKLWEHHPRKTMFFGKLAYGLSIPFLISAGLVRMSLKKFLSFTIPVTIFQYGIILAIGYSLGHSYYLAEQYIRDTYMAIAGIIVVCIIGYIAISKYARTTIEVLEKEEEKNVL